MQEWEKEGLERRIIVPGPPLLEELTLFDVRFRYDMGGNVWTEKTIWIGGHDFDEAYQKLKNTYDSPQIISVNSKGAVFI